MLQVSVPKEQFPTTGIRESHRAILDVVMRGNFSGLLLIIVPLIQTIDIHVFIMM
jgi:hypothetical protein